MRLDDIAETFLLGCFGTFVLAFISVLFYTSFKYPKIFSAIILIMLFIYGVGWCMNHWEKFHDLLFSQNVYSKTPTPSLSSCGIPTLDKLRDLEIKYNIGTIQFMSFACNNVMPVGIDNLDYLEWISLVNDLPLLNKERGE